MVHCWAKTLSDDTLSDISHVFWEIHDNDSQPLFLVFLTIFLQLGVHIFRHASWIWYLQKRCVPAGICDAQRTSWIRCADFIEKILHVLPFASFCMILPIIVYTQWPHIRTECGFVTWPVFAEDYDFSPSFPYRFRQCCDVVCPRVIQWTFNHIGKVPCAFNWFIWLLLHQHKYGLTRVFLQPSHGRIYGIGSEELLLEFNPMMNR